MNYLSVGSWGEFTCLRGLDRYSRLQLLRTGFLEMEAEGWMGKDEKKEGQDNRLPIKAKV